MQLLFIDESGTPPSIKKAAEAGYFVLGGVVIPEEVWLKLATDLKKIKVNYEVTGEIKWRFFAPDRGGPKHALSHLDGDRKNSLRLDLYKALTAYKSVKVISVVVNCEAEYKKGFAATPDAIYWAAYKQLTERFQYYLQDLSKIIGHSVHGIVVCDNRGPADDDNLRKVHSKLVTGTSREFVSNYSNVIEGLFIAPSHMSVGIQFADMVAGAIFRKFKAGDSRFYDLIHPSIRSSPAGKIVGYGLVKSPSGAW